MSRDNLTDQQRRFAEEYLIDTNASAAARRAGYADSRHNSNRLLRHPGIRAEIERGIQARTERTEITQDLVVRQLYAIATADAGEIVQHRRTCCRHCWGAGHLRQWTPAEYAEVGRTYRHRQELALERGKPFDEPEPDPAGGLDFDHTADPNPECPECRGEGVGTVHVVDTDLLSGPARLLYAGTKQTKDGIQVLLEDRMKAREMLGRHLGMFRDKLEVTGKDGGPVEINDVRDRIASRLARLSPG